MLNFILGFLAGFLSFVGLSFAIIFLGISYFRKHPEMVGQKLMRPLMKAASKKAKAA